MNHVQSHSKPTATESLFCKAMKRFACICAAGTLLLTAIAPLVAAPKAYQWTNLVSDIAGVALTTVNVANPEATPPVPLIRQGSTKVKLATVASGLTAPLELTSAADGTGRNSPYTEALTQAIREMHEPVEQVFKHVRVGVMSATSGKQVPWESSSLTGDFYFAAPSASRCSSKT